MQRIINKIDQKSNLKKKRKIALFDMDGTLLRGDMGEAVFCYLTSRKLIPMTQKEYIDIESESGVKVAYRHVAKIMAGLTVDQIIKLTNEIMLEEDDRFYFYENEYLKSCKIPKVNKEVFRILNYLKNIEFENYIISSTNTITVGEVAEKWFDIPADRCYGIRNILDNTGKLTEKLDEPAPIVEGKTHIYKNNISNEPPVLSFGDSINDVPMLNLTDPEGIIIIVQENDEKYDEILSYLDNPELAIRIM